jgi:glycosyltransferase involved in cell wall biosynthesis
MLSARASLPPGGAETQILTLAKDLARRGVRVAIIVYGEPSELPQTADGVSIHARREPRRGRGVRGKVLETLHICRALWSVPSRAIVHRGAGVDLGVIALYARLARRRLVFATASVSDFDWGALESNRLYRRTYEVGARLAHAIVVQTDEQAALCRSAFGRDPVVIKSIVSPAERSHDAPEAFLWVGRLVSYKRPLEYIALARAVPEARFWMVGVPTPHIESDQCVIDEVPKEAQGIANLELLPPRPHGELQSLMARAVASVNTADFEGMPNVLLEAWRLGVPALVLFHDPDGVVSRYGLGEFADGSWERFVAQARELWRARHDRADTADRCRGYVHAQHAPEAVTRRWLGVLEIAQTSGSEAPSTLRWQGPSPPPDRGGGATRGPLGASPPGFSPPG